MWRRAVHTSGTEQSMSFSHFFNYFWTKTVGKPTRKVFAAVVVAPAIVALTGRALALNFRYTIPCFEGFLDDLRQFFDLQVSTTYAYSIYAIRSTYGYIWPYAGQLMP